MTDRELLERAAKACALDGWYWNGDDMMYVKGHSYEKWRPLDDDGDAFRLAVDLNIPLRIDAETEILRNHQTLSWKSDTRKAFIRREIVRAAAAMAV